MSSETGAEAKVSTGSDGLQLYGLQEYVRMAVGIERAPRHQDLAPQGLEVLGW